MVNNERGRIMQAVYQKGIADSLGLPDIGPLAPAFNVPRIPRWPCIFTKRPCTSIHTCVRESILPTYAEIMAWRILGHLQIIEQDHSPLLVTPTLHGDWCWREGDDIKIHFCGQAGQMYVWQEGDYILYKRLPTQSWLCRVVAKLPNALGPQSATCVDVAIICNMLANV